MNPDFELTVYIAPTPNHKFYSLQENEYLQISTTKCVCVICIYILSLKHVTFCCTRVNFLKLTILGGSFFVLTRFSDCYKMFIKPGDEKE